MCCYRFACNHQISLSLPFSRRCGFAPFFKRFQVRNKLLFTQCLPAALRAINVLQRHLQWPRDKTKPSGSAKTPCGCGTWGHGGGGLGGAGGTVGLSVLRGIFQTNFLQRYISLTVYGQKLLVLHQLQDSSI